jgi:hypothetical protein
MLFSAHKLSIVIRSTLHNDAKQSLLVEAPSVRVKGLGFANHRLVTRMSLRKASEGSIDINVVHDDHSSRPLSGPGLLHFKANIVCAM